VSERARITAGLMAAGLLGGAGFGIGVVPTMAQDGQPTGAPGPAPTATPPATTEGPAVVGADPTPTPTAEATPTPAPTTTTEEPAVVGTPTAQDREDEQRRRETAQRTDAAGDAVVEAQRTARETDRAARRAAEAERLTGEGRNPDGSPSPENPGLSIALPGVTPIGVPNFFIEKFRIPPFLLPIYQAAGIEYGIRWEILAAINEIETDYGRNLNISSAGALGWMQFMPATWKQYGVDANRDQKKDPFNPVDAIFAAARYLKAAGADQDIRKAIFAYNHADWYVESVLMRARLIAGLPTDLVGSLTGLTQGRFPVHAKATYADDIDEREATARVAKGKNAARVVESSSTRRGVDIFARSGSRVIAVQDGKVVRMGITRRLGRFVQLRDVYGNTYTYAHLGRIASTHLVPAEARTQRQQRKDATGADALARQEAAAATASASGAPAPPSSKQRLFAHPARPAAYRAGGGRQLATADSATPIDLGAADDPALGSVGPQVGKGVRLVARPLRPGSRVLAGSTLGRIGKPTKKVGSHLRFEIRPAGRGAPRIDPKPILDGWKLLESTAIYRAKGQNPLFGPDAAHPTIGQLLLLGKDALARRVLANPRIELYPCGREDIRAGAVDRRVLALLEFLAASGMEPTVTSLRCGHGYLTASGNVSEHTTGTAVDIAKINGIPILGHQGEGSITDLAVRRLLTLQGTMKPHQIITLMSYQGTDNTIALPDHDDHIHVGFRPQIAANGKRVRNLDTVLKPGQWTKLIDRLGKLPNPEVAETPSDAAIPVGAARSGHGD